MSLPKEILEWAVWANLDRHKDVELALLKGHLIIEVLVNGAIDKHLSKGQHISSLNLQFAKKIHLLYLLSKDSSPKAKDAHDLLLRLNAIRNKLAHDFEFEHEDSNLAQWAEEVLAKLPVNKMTRYTYRTRIAHAFAALGRELYETQ